MYNFWYKRHGRSKWDPIGGVLKSLELVRVANLAIDFDELTKVYDLFWNNSQKSRKRSWEPYRQPFSSLLLEEEEEKKSQKPGVHWIKLQIQPAKSLQNQNIFKFWTTNNMEQTIKRSNSIPLTISCGYFGRTLFFGYFGKVGGKSD